MLRIIARKMSTNVTSIINNAEKAEKRLIELKSKLEQVKKFKVEEKVKELSQENEFLLKKIEQAKIDLVKLETLHGKKQYTLPGKTACTAGNLEVSKSKLQDMSENEPVTKKDKKDVAKKANEKIAANTDTDIVDVRKLDMRIGKIVEIDKHPDADSLYVEKVDCGEDRLRTVISGLVKHVPIDELYERIVVVICNLKPVKMRGITSEAMLICAVSPEKIEVLIPPAGSVPGDLVSCEGYPREPEPQLNPKKKVFETCAPDLKTNGDGIACYKGSPLVVIGKGPIKALTLRGVNVK